MRIANLFDVSSFARILIIVFGVSLAWLGSDAVADDLTCGFVPLNYTGVTEDFTIPLNDPPAGITLRLVGADGGAAQLESCGSTDCDICRSEGGLGAEVIASFAIGTGPDQLAPGSTLRFVVGQAGESGENFTTGSIGTVAGAGGGGSGLLYRPPGATGNSCSDDWQVLLVAGGGGGAYQGVAPVVGCTGGKTGQDGQLDPGGSAGNGGGGQGGVGGQNGNGGACGGGAGAGGGAFTDGDSSCNRSGDAGCVGGGNGGNATLEGGWGFGGGGGTNATLGGGGGGGYSGGGGGGSSNRGGGGGSYVSSMALSSTVQTAGGNNPNGSADLICDCALTPPENDECVNATPLFLGTTPGCNELATTSTESSCGPVGIANDVWYSYTNDSPCAVQLTLDWCGSPLFIQSAFYSACGGTQQQCSVGDCNKSVNLAAGETTIFRIGGVGGVLVTRGDFSITASVTHVSGDTDGDGTPDDCDACPLDAPDDIDQDGVCNSNDPCPNSSQDLCTSVNDFDCPYTTDNWLNGGIPGGFSTIFSSGRMFYNVALGSAPVSERFAIFETPVIPGGNLTFDYLFEGDHGAAGARAIFRFAVVGPTGQQTYSVFNQPVDGEFSFSGSISVPLNGSTFGLIVGGSSPGNQMNGSIALSNITWPGVTDGDQDTVPDPCDICTNGSDLVDADDDGIPDACDACPLGDNNLDSDNDGVADACDPCPIDPLDDSDGDGTCDSQDICNGFDDALDADADTVPDGCDNCPGDNDLIDADNDGQPDGCDPCPQDEFDDSDGDGVCDSVDVCQGFDDHLDINTDGVPDNCACDSPPLPEAAVATDDLIDFVAVNSVDNMLDVLSNDIELGGEFITCVTQQPDNGSAVVTNAGTVIRYTPDATYCNDAIPSAPDTFTYRLSGGSEATVSVVVACPYVLRDPGDFDTDGDPEVLTWFEARTFCRLNVGTDMAHSKCETENPSGGCAGTGGCGEISPANGLACPDIPACLPTDSPTLCGRRQIAEMMRVGQETRVNFWTGIRPFFQRCSESGSSCDSQGSMSWIDGTPITNALFPLRYIGATFTTGNLTAYADGECGYIYGEFGLTGALSCVCVGGANDGQPCDGSVESCPDGMCESSLAPGTPCTLCGCYSMDDFGTACTSDDDCAVDGVCFDGPEGVACTGAGFGLIDHTRCDGTATNVDQVLCDNPKLGFEVCGCDDPDNCPDGINSCGPGRTCSSINICWPEGPAQIGEACQFHNDCASGLMCDVNCERNQECSHTNNTYLPMYFPQHDGHHFCVPTVPAQLNDFDNDGFFDQEESCFADPSKTTPDDCGCGVPDDDTDSDAVPDCDDMCPGFDDLLDSDADGVPDGCDLCPGFDDMIDADTDGLPDACDPCPVANPVDSDNDGVCDTIDRCLGFDDNQDCNTNGVPDGCDLLHPGRFEDFTIGSGDYTLNGSASIVDGSVRLTPIAQNQLGSVIFATPTQQPIESFTVRFDFKMGGGSGADGMSFALINADNSPDTIMFGETGDVQPLAIGFDTYRGDAAGGNHVLLRSFAVTLADVQIDYPLDDNTWQSALVTYESGAASLVLTDAQGVETTVFDSILVPGLTPYRARYGFGGRTGGATNAHFMDNVLFRETALINDCDSNAIPDQCDPDTDSDRVVDGCDRCPGFEDSIDSDADGVPDGCDVCLGGNDSADLDGDNTPDACDPCAGGLASGDVNADGAITIVDYRAMAVCMFGPNESYTTGCECFDWDIDGDNDLFDYAVFQDGFTTP